jgi:hypothetical protein
MLLSKSGPTDICPHPLPAIRSHDRMPMPTKRGAKRSATPTRCSIEMLRQIKSAVKLRCAKLCFGSSMVPSAMPAGVNSKGYALVWRYCLKSGSCVIAQ